MSYHYTAEQEQTKLDFFNSTSKEIKKWKTLRQTHISSIRTIDNILRELGVATI